MRKVLIGSMIVSLGLAGLFLVAGRGVREFFGYARATADSTVDQLTNQLPQDVRDRKLEQELDTARQELIDRQVRVSQSKMRITDLKTEVSKLDSSVDRRKQLLAQAYPILEQAVRQNQTQVRFASTNLPTGEFQREIDDLLATQKREESQLTLKRDSLNRLEQSAKEAELALQEMRQALDTAQQEVELLKTRRDQAEMESQTLELVNSATSRQRKASESLGRDLDQLRKEVGHMEAQNEAKRDLSPVSDRQSTNRLSREFSRLEALKAIRDQAAPASKDQKKIEKAADTLPNNSENRSQVQFVD